MEVRFNLDNCLALQVLAAAPTSSIAEVTREALSLLKWAIRHSKQGCTIAALDPTGDIQELATTPILTQVHNEKFRTNMDKPPSAANDR